MPPRKHPSAGCPDELRLLRRQLQGAVAAILKRTGVTQAELARRCGMTQGSVSYFLYSDGAKTTDRLLEFLYRLGADVSVRVDTRGELGLGRRELDVDLPPAPSAVKAKASAHDC